MRDRMRAPNIVGMERDRAAAELFGFGIIAAFLDPESMAAERIPVAGRALSQAASADPTVSRMSRQSPW